MTYSPPAELVERVKHAIGHDTLCTSFDFNTMECGCHLDRRARACLTASGLGEALGLLRRFVAEWQLERNDPQFSDPLAAEARALLARLDTQNE